MHMTAVKLIFDKHRDDLIRKKQNYIIFSITLQ